MRVLSFYNFILRQLVILFAKAPVAGRVKTRFGAAIGMGWAARFHSAFAADTAARAAERYRIELHTDVAGNAWPEINAERRLQCDGPLGQRMYTALDDALRRGWEQVAILGSDAPDLPAGHLNAIFASGADVALGPAEDGGYWGICCRRVAAGMFDGVEWSTPRALAGTVAACERAGLSVSCGPVWPDVDELADLRRLASSDSFDPRGATAKLLAEYWLRGSEGAW